MPRSLTRWFWQGDEGWFFQLRYGARVLDLGKGKNAIAAVNEKELLATIGTCIDAVKAGELDKAIEEVAAMRKGRLKA